MSQLPHFWCLFLSCQQQKNTENGAAVTSLRSSLFRDDFSLPILPFYDVHALKLSYSATVVLKVNI